MKKPKKRSRTTEKETQTDRRELGKILIHKKETQREQEKEERDKKKGREKRDTSLR